MLLNTGQWLNSAHIRAAYGIMLKIAMWQKNEAAFNALWEQMEKDGVPPKTGALTALMELHRLKGERDKVVEVSNNPIRQLQKYYY